MRIVLKKLGRKQQELTDEVKEWLPVRLDSVDIWYMTPGRKGNI